MFYSNQRYRRIDFRICLVLLDPRVDEASNCLVQFVTVCCRRNEASSCLGISLMLYASPITPSSDSVNLNCVKWRYRILRWSKQSWSFHTCDITSEFWNVTNLLSVAEFWNVSRFVVICCSTNLFAETVLDGTSAMRCSSYNPCCTNLDLLLLCFRGWNVESMLGTVGTDWTTLPNRLQPGPKVPS